MAATTLVFNLTNTPTFGPPDGYCGRSTFGQVTGYAPGNGPRQFPLAGCAGLCARSRSWSP